MITSGKLVNKWVFGVAVASLTACASQPEDIPTSYVSPIQYRSFDCEQLAAEAMRVNRRASDLQGILNKTADTDQIQMGVGLILLWPTLFFLEGGDGPQAQEYARLKGEQDAIQQAVTMKKCSGPKPWVLPSDQIEKTSIEERLINLEKLLKEDLLTEEEAALKRNEILEGL